MKILFVLDMQSKMAVHEYDKEFDNMMTKFPYFDCLRATQFQGNTVLKKNGVPKITIQRKFHGAESIPFG